MSALLFGYARCSTDQQDLTAQRDSLLGLGVEAARIYVEHGLTGTNRERPRLREALAACRALRVPDASCTLEDWLSEWPITFLEASNRARSTSAASLDRRRPCASHRRAPHSIRVPRSARGRSRRQRSPLGRGRGRQAWRTDGRRAS